MNQQQQGLLERLQQIDAYEFEELVADLWTKQGWETSVTSAANDRGVDIIAEQSSPYPQKQAIQAKRYNPENSIGRPDIQQYASVRQERTDVDAVIVVTTGTFTDEARAAARNLNVKLIDGSRLYNLIDALDAFDLVDSYLSHGSDQGSTVSREVDAGAFQNDSDDTTSFLGSDNKEPQVGNVPKTIPALLAVRQEITSNLNQLESKLENAEGAIEEDNYREAVEYYQKAGTLRAQSQRGIAQYDAGLTSIDVATAEHLPSTDTFLNRLHQLDERFRESSPEAIHNAERIQGLEQLVEELTENGETITEYLSRGDEILNQNGRSFEDAASWYRKAANALEQLRETMEVYEGLCAEYDPVIVENHSGLPKEFSVAEVESEVDRRLGSQSAYEDLEVVSEEALGSFDASLLTNNDGELFEKELYEYVPDDETLEFVFEPPRRGFKISEAGGSPLPFHDDPFAAGSSFLLITDQRVLYVAGVEGHDETVSIPFEDIDDVSPTVDASTKSLRFTLTAGDQYEFDGLRDRPSDIEPATKYAKKRLE